MSAADSVTDERLGAIHEAAHAVAARHFGMTVTRCTLTFCDSTITPRPYRALVKIRGEDAYRMREPYETPQVAEQLTQLAVGEMAARYWYGIDGTGAQDYDDSVALLKSLGADAATVEKMMAATVYRALKVVKKLERRIERVADALIARGELSGREIDALIESCNVVEVAA